MRRFRLLPLLLFGGYALYYYFSNQETVPMTGRKQLVDLSREQEAALGLQTFREVLQAENVMRSGGAVDVVRTIGERIAKAAEASGDAKGFEWEFAVIRSDQANAFCLPGGKVAVYTGILPVAKNDSGLAAIMGHEIAHAIARHGAERMAHQKLLQIGTIAAGAALGDMDETTRRGVMGALGVGAQFGVMLPFSRNHESEADHMGLMYSARACFDPEEAPKLWVRMGEASKGRGTAEFMSTHPSHETRIRQLEGWMPEAQAEKKKACGG